MNATAKRLRENDLKVTPQRLAIYDYLMINKMHPIAEQIYADLSEQYPMMSLSTVYKTLDALKEKGLVKELNACEDSFRYDANTEPHDHFYCLGCKTLTDVGGSEQKLTIMPDSLKAYKIKYESMYYFGHCPKCAN